MFNKLMLNMDFIKNKVKSVYCGVFRYYFEKKDSNIESESKLTPYFCIKEKRIYESVCNALEGRFVIIPKVRVSDIFKNQGAMTKDEIIELGLFDPDTFNLIAAIHSSSSMAIELKNQLKENCVPIIEINPHVEISINVLRDDILDIVNGTAVFSIGPPINTKYH